MSAPAPTGLCRRCARRGWLLAQLSGPLDARASDPERLWPALELDGRELIAALGGCGRDELQERWERMGMDTRESSQRGHGAHEEVSVCRHHCLYPKRLHRDPLAPHALALGGGEAAKRLGGEQKVVAIAGTHDPSDYGLRAARTIAADLAAAGATVAGAAAGIGTAARAGAREAGGWTLAVTAARARLSAGTTAAAASGPGGARQLRIAELVASDDATRHRWLPIAAERTLALLADLVLVVEAREGQAIDLACADVAQSRQIPVAAMPGPVDSPASRASNRLLARGAAPVCSAREALDLLFAVDAPTSVRKSSSRAGNGHAATRCDARLPRRAPPAPAPPSRERCPRPGAPAAIDERLQTVLDLAAGGERTLAELGHDLADAAAAAIAVTELELLGLIARCDDGRYRTVGGAGHLRRSVSCAANPAADR